MPSKKKSEVLAGRLRALAQRLAGGEGLPSGYGAEVETALSHLERLLETGQPQPPAGGATGEAGSGISAGASREKGDAASGTIRIWCDGSCAPNPGAGGWGAILERDGVREELSGAAQESTNNMMEMTAAIEALRRTPSGAEVELTTDSQYLKNGITRWIHNWKRNGWRKADGGAVLNQGLWRQLDVLAGERRIRWGWIRGHTGHPENERCDALANLARQSLSG